MCLDHRHKICLWFGLESSQKTMQEQSQHKTEARFRLSTPKNPYDNLLFDQIDGIELFLFFWVQILSYLPLLQEGSPRHSAVVKIPRR